MRDDGHNSVRRNRHPQVGFEGRCLLLTCSQHRAWNKARAKNKNSARQDSLQKASSPVIMIYIIMIYISMTYISADNAADAFARLLADILYNLHAVSFAA